VSHTFLPRILSIASQLLPFRLGGTQLFLVLS
jgi:hypothetical protein